MNNVSKKKEAFNLVPELYDQIRPEYPISILQQIEDYARLNSKSKIVEIGPGTGQASDYFIKRGYNFLGIELGAELAAFAEKKYASNANSRFLCSSFEDWDSRNKSYELLLAAQCFHWIDTDSGIKKAAQVLKRDGVIAVMWNLEESQHTEFWKRGTDLHEEYFPPEMEDGKGLAQWSQEFAKALEQSSLFSDAHAVEYEWQKRYSADEWIQMRNTFSRDIRMEPSRRKEFYGRLRELIEDLGGSFIRCYRCICHLARCTQ
jgi:SAM-dependent methyltransferase